MIENIRNIAIIAHVDHGKTTLVRPVAPAIGDPKWSNGVH
ncbi:GTP-binding protein [Candidatus Coxiella mudrowiae]